MKTIPITNSNNDVVAVAIVDDEDYPLVNSFKWNVNSNGYLIGEVIDPETRTRRKIQMHRFIMGLDHGDSRFVDHINGNKHDNRRSNLRFATPSQNSQNLPTLNNIGDSQYRGVTKSITEGKWKASGGLDGKTYYLGTFDTELEAAQYAAAWRRTHYTHTRPDDEELAKHFPDPIPLSPRTGKLKPRVKENKHTYSVAIYDRGMGNKNNLHIATLKKSEYTLDSAVALQVECQKAWDEGDYDYVNSIRSQHGTF